MSTVANEPQVTPEDVLRMRGFELVNGHLREKKGSILSSYVSGRVCQSLCEFVTARGLGWVLPAGASFQCFTTEPTRVRRPSGAFIRFSRLPADEVRSDGHCRVVPDLVVEVISPNDLAYEVAQTADDWLDAGAELAWVVNPKTKRVLARTPGKPVQELGGNDVLTGEPVLPEFSCPVANFFRLPQAPPASNGS